MEKKGDLLNQLAIIADLVEKVNINSNTNTLVIELNEEEFNKTFIYINSKYGRNMKTPKSTFTINFGILDIVFNKSSV